MLPSLLIPYIPLILYSSFPSLSHSLTIPSDPVLPHPFPLLSVPCSSSHPFPSSTSLLIHFRPFHPFSSLSIPSLPNLPASLSSRLSQSLPMFPIPSHSFQYSPIPSDPLSSPSLTIPYYPIPSDPLIPHPFPLTSVPYVSFFFPSLPIPYLPSDSFSSLSSFLNPSYTFPS